MLEVYPLSIPSIDWNTYITQSKECLGINPVRALDGQCMDSHKPASFVSTLDRSIHRSPQEALRKSYCNGILFHSYCSFLVICEEKLLIEMCTHSPIDIIHKTFDSDKCFSIISANMYNWMYTVLTFCSSKRNLTLRRLGNQLYVFLCQAGYKEIWSDYTKIPDSENTFTLKRK